MMESIPFTDTSDSEQSTDIANNMVMVFADQVKKGILPWHKVPLSLRSAVSYILDRGE